MGAEVTMICIDNSLSVTENPNISKAQRDAIEYYSETKLKMNQENAVGAATMGSAQFCIALRPTRDLEKIKCETQGLRVGGEFDFYHGVQTAQVGFSDFPKEMKKRFLIFVGSPLCYEVEDLETLGTFLKERGVAIYVVNFDLNDADESQWNKEKLDAFVAAANNNDNSRIVHVKPEPSIRDALSRSKIVPSVPKAVSCLSVEEERARQKVQPYEGCQNVEPPHMKNIHHNQVLHHSEKKRTPLLPVKKSQEKAKKIEQVSGKGKNQAAADDEYVGASDTKDGLSVPMHEHLAVVEELNRLKLKYGVRT